MAKQRITIDPAALVKQARREGREEALAEFRDALVAFQLMSTWLDGRCVGADFDGANSWMPGARAWLVKLVDHLDNE